MNLVSNNRYFNNSIKTFFDKNPRIKENNSICDVDAIQQCPNSSNVNYINHIQIIIFLVINTDIMFNIKKIRI